MSGTFCTDEHVTHHYCFKIFPLDRMVVRSRNNDHHCFCHHYHRQGSSRVLLSSLLQLILVMMRLSWPFTGPSWSIVMETDDSKENSVCWSTLWSYLWPNGAWIFFLFFCLCTLKELWCNRPKGATCESLGQGWSDRPKNKIIVTTLEARDLRKRKYWRLQRACDQRDKSTV